jgi:hypothetical protein
MRVTSRDGRYQVTITGKLAGRDLRRLERACGPALEHSRPPLTVRLGAVAAIDDSAKAYIDRLIRRGAIVAFD